MKQERVDKFNYYLDIVRNSSTTKHLPQKNLRCGDRSA